MLETVHEGVNSVVIADEEPNLTLLGEIEQNLGRIRLKSCVYNW
jgi:hypothetical protein